jgi:hypothetical protein
MQGNLLPLESLAAASVFGGEGSRIHDLDTEQELGRARPQVAHHFDEHLERFRLLLEQRVFLPPSAILDPALQLVELV